MIFIALCIIGVLHLGITLLLTAAFKSYKSPFNQNQESLSIVIAARNEESNLKNHVPLLLAQDFPKFEVIIALDRCTDQSKAYLDGLNNSKISWIDIKEVAANWNPKKFALNQAISKATGEWLVFTDADCIPASDQWLKTLNNHITNEKNILIGISPYQSNGTFLSYFIQFEAFMTAFLYISRVLLGKPYMGVGRNMAVRKSFFEATGGYESCKSVTGGDDDLFIQRNATKSNIQVVLGRESLMYTKPETSWKAYWHQKIRHLSVGKVYKARDQAFLTLFHLIHLSTLILLLFATTQSFFFPMLLFYLFIKLVSYRFAASKMEVNINYILLPLVDIIYAVLIPGIALWSKLEKDIKWKN
ncbi:glycosyltransferase [Ekhidna sp. To15]|uniref:glycosyltransferase n=1 Tax=Ekhidna sp. To15 TaxID=3395267 RepID=UPI003F51FB92